MQFQFIKDIFGTNYIGIDIKFSTTDKNGVQFIDLLTKADKLVDNFFEYHEKLLTRNHNKYHMTVFSVMEYIKNSSTDDIVGSTVNAESIEFKGIGSITKDDKTTYFVVVESELINKVRIANGLEPKDLHVTIAYTHKDLFHDRKTNTNILTV